MTDEIYRDDHVVLDDRGITTAAATSRWHRPSHILYGDITGVLEKDTVLVIDTGGQVKACVTPDDPWRVIELLRKRVPVAPE
jgi:hypothetical protein